MRAAGMSRSAFVELAVGCGARHDAALGMHAELVARHGEAHRRYHTLSHVGWVLAALEVTAAGVADTRAVRMAAWWHDAIYDTAARDNEQRSASRARVALTAAGCAEPFADDVARLVEATAHHVPAAGDEAALCDADLWVLGAGPVGYERYRAGVFHEYVTAGRLDLRRWRAGRARALEGLLALERLFHTPAGQAREQRARANLRAELAQLTEPSAGPGSAGTVGP